MKALKLREATALNGVVPVVNVMASFTDRRSHSEQGLLTLKGK
jgi:hypothetical protein